MPSFDIVSEVNLQEVDNAVNQTAKEIGTRYDFKGSQCKVEHEEAVITITADDDYKLEQVVDVLKEKMVRRKIEPGSLDFAKPEQASGNLVRQVVTVKQGIETELAKKICKMIKGSKIKVQAAIQGEEIRITGKKRDDLQEAIAKVKESGYELPLQFINFRD
ncbi:MAG: YajQ family cyclic di-GMP-binding protein [Nitrospirae bacterium]|nr:YajQ family cyclic di-GMP-binding protein [Magnetococcales bacterium]HAT51521.1 YajQ family cyclic di-GMP-binding protein [Alphaproteobacteria bacterium]